MAAATPLHFTNYHSTPTAAMASTMSIVSLGVPRTHSSTTLASMRTNLPTPTIAAAATTSFVSDGGIDIDLPWPPLWLTVSAFVLTGAAVVLAVCVWMISWPPDDDDGDAVEGQQGGDMEVEEVEEEGWSSDEEDRETTWMMGKTFEDAVELKRLLSNTTPPPSPPFAVERGDEQRGNRRNMHDLRLELSAAAGVGVGSWGRGDAGRRRCVASQTDHHHDYAVKNDGCTHRKNEDETDSLLSLSLASDADTEAGLVDSSIGAGAGATASSTTLTSSSTSKPDFNRPLHGWRKAVDDRVGVLASWIERYVADGGREKDLLCKIRQDERGDVVCGFEF